jgi:DNA polymerase III sliding clamp (beta) subunit (PCNA family)
MNIKISVDKLKEDLTVVGLIKKSIKNNDLISNSVGFVIKDNFLTIVATNFIQTFTVTHEVDIDSKNHLDFGCYGEYSQLYNGLRMMKDGIINLYFEQDSLTITHKKYKLVMNINVMDIHSINKDDIKEVWRKEITNKELKRMIQILNIFCENKSVTPISKGVWIKKENDNNLFVFTNQKNICIMKIAENFPGGFNKLIPLELFNIASGYSNDVMELVIGGTSSQIITSDRSISSPNIISTLPKNVLPVIDKYTVSDKFFHINKRELLDGLAFTKPFSNDFGKLKMSFEKDNIVISCMGASASIPYENTTTLPEFIYANIDSLYNVISVIPEENFKMILSENDSGLSYISEDGNFIVLTMLLNIKNGG